MTSPLKRITKIPNQPRKGPTKPRTQRSLHDPRSIGGHQDPRPHEHFQPRRNRIIKREEFPPTTTPARENDYRIAPVVRYPAADQAAPCGSPRRAEAGEGPDRSPRASERRAVQGVGLGVARDPAGGLSAGFDSTALCSGLRVRSSRR